MLLQFARGRVAGLLGQDVAQGGLRVGRAVGGEGALRIGGEHGQARRALQFAGQAERARVRGVDGLQARQRGACGRQLAGRARTVALVRELRDRAFACAQQRGSQRVVGRVDARRAVEHGERLLVLPCERELLRVAQCGVGAAGQQQRGHDQGRRSVSGSGQGKA